jgi:mono/diheme cytochrome c family protein
MNRALLPLAFAALALAEGTTPAKPATAPTPTPTKTGAPVSERERIYNEKIAPLMEKSCVSCHSVKKAKGHFRADSLTGLIKGGEDAGEGISWGKPKESSVYLLAAANRSEKMAMPPKKSDKPALTPAELETLKNWIEASK